MITSPVIAKVSPALDWNSLALVNQLDSSHRSAINRVIELLKPLVVMRVPGGEEFTDHDFAHSTRVVERIGKILPPSTKLASPELYVLLLAALLHDFGMWTSRTEAAAIAKSPEFAVAAKRISPKLFDLLGSDSGGRDWLSMIVLQRLVFLMHREVHANRLQQTITAENPTSPIHELQVLVGADFVDAVAQVSAAHGWDADRVRSDDSLRPREIGGSLCNMRYLAQLLRLGDLLDLGDGRVSTLVWHYLEPLPLDSEAHWRKERTLLLERCDSELIQVSGTFDIDQDGTVAADAYTLARDWLTWLEREIESAHLVVARQEEVFQKRCGLGSLRLDCSRVAAKGLLLAGDVRLEVDRERLLQLLGDDVYIDGCVFARELIQNAIDATRTQIVQDQINSGRSRELSSANAPWRWPKEIVDDDKYAIAVDVDLTNSDRVTFQVVDKGIGMTLAQVKDYFLQVGKSYYKSAEFKQRFGHGSISEFGIGFLSCLVVADAVTVKTMSRADVAGIQLNYRRPSSHFTISPLRTPQCGTSVMLEFRKDAPRPKDWNKLPDLMSNLKMGTHEKAAMLSQVVPAIRGWTQCIELPINVNEKRVNAGLRSHLGFTGPKVLDMRIVVQGLSGEVIMDGKCVCDLNDGVPLLRPKYSFDSGLDFADLSLGKQGFTTAAVTNTWSRGAFIWLNADQLPSGALSSGRQPRSWFADWLARVRKEICVGVTMRIVQILRERDPVVASLWFQSRFEAEAATLLPKDVILFPSRLGKRLEWLTASQVNSCGPFLLVPFGVAYGRPWSGSMRWVGWHPMSKMSRTTLKSAYIRPIPGVCSAIEVGGGEGRGRKGRVCPDVTYLMEECVRVPKSGRVSQAKSVEAGTVADRLPKYDGRGNPWFVHPTNLHYASRDASPTERARVLRKIEKFLAKACQSTKWPSTIRITMDTSGREWRIDSMSVQ